MTVPPLLDPPRPLSTSASTSAFFSNATLSAAVITDFLPSRANFMSWSLLSIAFALPPTQGVVSPIFVSSSAPAFASLNGVSYDASPAIVSRPVVGLSSNVQAPSVDPLKAVTSSWCLRLISSSSACLASSKFWALANSPAT